MENNKCIKNITDKLLCLLDSTDIFTLLKNKNNNKNYENIVKYFCKNNNIDDILFGKYTLLYNASINNNIEQVNILLKYGADPFNIFKYKNSFIYNSANVELLSILFKNYYNPEYIDNNLKLKLYTVIQLRFIRKHNFTAIKTMLKYWDINFSKVQFMEDGNTLLHYITMIPESASLISIIKLILKKNNFENWNVKNKYKLTPIFHCVIYNNIKMFTLIIDKVDLSYKPQNLNMTLLQFIQKRNKYNFLKKYIEYEQNFLITKLITK